MPTRDIFDLKLIEQNRRRAHLENRQGADFLLHCLGADLGERLHFIKRHFSHALELHAQTACIGDILRQSGKVGTLEQLPKSMKRFSEPEEIKTVLTSLDLKTLNSENLTLPAQSVDLIVSLGHLHLTNDTPGMLVQIRQALRPDGLFIAALAGQGTLAELRESFLQAESEIYGGVSPRIAPFMDVRDAGSLMQRAGFALPVTDGQDIRVRYSDLFALMRDLHAMGMQNALLSRPRKPVSRRFFARVSEIYASRFSDEDGRIRATFSFIWLTGWAPHPAQQKPLKPGSATVSLSDALRQL